MELSLQSKLDARKTSHFNVTLNPQERFILASLLNDAYIGLEKDLNNKKISELGATQLSNTLRTVKSLQRKVI